MRYQDALADLEARQPHRIVPDLDRIRALVELMNHPEGTYPSVHVAGTNGKTTTARLISRILCAHGLSTGLYTSPHLHSVTERIALCDEPISDEELSEEYGHLKPYMDQVDAEGGERVTYFEALTALALLWFADKPVDASVLEVGMGGRWDATNVVDAPVAVICSIDLDHPELGSTIGEVAREKAAIIKPGATAVVADNGPDALRVVEERAAAVGATVLLRDRDFRVPVRSVAVGGQHLAVRGVKGEYRDLFLPLHGAHQAENAATAVASAEIFLGRALDEKALRVALEEATSPGRLEVVSRQPLVVLDGAHNPEAARVVAAAIGEAFVWGRLHLVLGVLSTKDLDGIVGALAPRADHIYACASSHPSPYPPERVAEACQRAGVPATPLPTVEAALRAAETAAEENDLILVTGSLYTVADARRRYVAG